MDFAEGTVLKIEELWIPRIRILLPSWICEWVNSILFKASPWVEFKVRNYWPRGPQRSPRNDYISVNGFMKFVLSGKIESRIKVARALKRVQRQWTDDPLWCSRQSIWVWDSNLKTLNSLQYERATTTEEQLYTFHFHNPHSGFRYEFHFDITINRLH